MKDNKGEKKAKSEQVVQVTMCGGGELHQIFASSATRTLGLGHLVGYSEYNRTIVLLVVRQSSEL